VSAIVIGLAAFALLTLMIYLGVQISTALLVIAFFGTWAVRGDFNLAADMLALAATDAVTDYDFGVIPLFVLMGFLVMISGVGRDSYLIAHHAFRRVPGGLGQATVVGNAIFSAITGVSVAAVVLFTKLAVPEMIERGYAKRFAVGVVAGSAMLGMLIPPSVLMIVYAVLTEISIGDLFIAGIVPGILLSGMFCGAIWVMAKRDPGHFGANHPDTGPAPSMRELANQAIPVTALILLVLGGMYMGVFTATEGGAVGAAASLVLAWWRGALDWPTFKKLLQDTGYVTASLILIIASANMFARFLAIAGVPSALNEWIAHMQLGLWSVMLVYVIVLLFLGTALDSASTVLISVPLFAPLFKALGADLVWIGIITMIATEIGLITPPLGMAPFVLKSTLTDKSITLNDIYAGAFPFALAAMVTLGLIIAFPKLAIGFL
jgi:tripartite ATP-independent transporter DctM subunit